MSRSFLTSRTRRRGQALLLAVLIMIFAALLSASFLVVVSVNLNQTARQTDKNRALVAANAGLAHIEQQISSSAEGDKWRTELENVPPAPGDVDFAAYYTPLDMAQGWARDIGHPTGIAGDLNGNGKYYDGSNRNTIDPGDEKIALAIARSTGKLELVKSPDPRSFGNQASDSPTYLSQVEQVPNSAGYNVAGALKITVIGLSTEDPTAYSRTVAYIGGNNDAPMARTMWTVGNYDFKNNVVPVAQAGSYDTLTNKLTLSNGSGNFPDVPFTVMIGDPQTAVGLRGATVVEKVGNVLTLAQPVTPAIQVDNPTLNIVGERVGLAANLGAPATIDINNDGMATEPVDFKTSDPVPTPTPTPGPTPAMPAPTAVPTPRAGGIRANGSLWLQGNVSAEAMGGTQNAYTPANPIPASIRASNFIAFTAPAPAATPAPILISGPVFANATPVPIVDSFNPNFPGAGPTWPTSAQIKDSVISDGMNRFKGVPSTNNATRNVSDFRPPNIGSGLGADRYRNIARSSDIAAGYMGSVGALYGYGQGIYIDNTQDRERIYDVPTSKYRDMTQTEMVQMWLSRFPTGATVIPAYARIGTPSGVATSSLEEKHLRGWVGPDEFRARGVEVVLGNDGAGNPIVTITRDARDDATPLGASPNTTWKDPTGMPLQGVYTKILPWPTTGVIFAEGNVRIRGKAFKAPNSLTVVSMGNIYIEDSLGADADTDGDINTPAGLPRRILLMAKKNVVMNPTRVISHPDNQTVSTNGAAINVTVNNPATIGVADISGFQIGDVIETTTVATAAGNADCIAQITALAPTSITAKVVYSLTGTIAVNSSVRNRPESNALKTGVGFSKIGTIQDVIQRRFTLPSVPSPAPTAVPSTIRLDIRHQGLSTPEVNATPLPTPVANFKVVDPPAGFNRINSPVDTVFLSNKRVLDSMGTFVPTATINSDLNKLLRADYSSPLPAGTTPFFATRPSDDNDAKTSQFSLAALEVEMDSALNSTPGPPPVGYKYDVTPNPAYGGVPFYYLASVGNRLDFAPFTSAERRKDILALSPPPAPFNPGYNLPLATSIGFSLNGSGFSLNGIGVGISDDTSTTAKTTQFGFNPLFTDVSATPTRSGEDILTNDQSFYQLTGAVRNVTVDSRVLPNWTVGFNSLVLRQSEGLVGVADATDPLPDYRIMGMKIEDVDLATNILKTGYTFNVNAYVYAQQGSWFVIPGADYETRVLGDATKSYYDFNDNKTPDPGEWIDGTNGGNVIGTFDAGDAADLNRNGIIDPGEVIAALRFSTRYNYQIDFNGAIAENQTAIVNTVYNPSVPTQIVQPGAVDDWMNKWLTTKYTAMPTPVVNNDRIHYVFDPTVALSNFNVQDEGFKLPQTSEVFYQD